MEKSMWFIFFQIVMVLLLFGTPSIYPEIVVYDGYNSGKTSVDGVRVFYKNLMREGIPDDLQIIQITIQVDEFENNKAKLVVCDQDWNYVLDVNVCPEIGDHSVYKFVLNKLYSKHSKIDLYVKEGEEMYWATIRLSSVIENHDPKKGKTDHPPQQ